MSCKPYLDLISARLDGALTPEQAEQLNAHIQGCPACRAIAKDLECMHSALSGCQVPAPAQLSEQVMTQIRAEKRSRRRFVRQLTGLAACLVLCVTAWYVGLADLTADPQRLSDPWRAAPVSLTGAPRATVSPCEKWRLSSFDAPAAPSAHLLASVDSLSAFLTRFPDTDLSAVSAAYGEDFFLSNRLLAVVMQEPSSSITHTLFELTADRVTVLRHVPEAGDSDMAPWLLIAPTQLDGPERILAVEFIDS